MAQKKLSPKKCSNVEANDVLYVRNVPPKYARAIREFAKENGMTLAGVIMHLAKDLNAQADHRNIG